MTDNWTDQLAGARMQVDQRFQDRLDASEFTNQEWGLIMTAVDWTVEDPGDPDEATLVADTSKLPDVVPELRAIQKEMGGAPTPVKEGPNTKGIFGRFRQYFHSLTSGGNEASNKQIEDAEELVSEYTESLQAYLEERGRWEDICAAAARHQGETTPES